jgi:hypothetical protein
VSTIKSVEKRIEAIEGFRVTIKHGRDGRDVRSDKQGIPQYGYERAAKGRMSVKDWRDGRFAKAYPGFEVDVINEDGRIAHGRTLLVTVRDGYLPD